MGRLITIDPVTRLEGHGRIDIFLDGTILSMVADGAATPDHLQ